MDNLTFKYRISVVDASFERNTIKHIRLQSAQYYKKNDPQPHFISLHFFEHNNDMLI